MILSTGSPTLPHSISEVGFLILFKVKEMYGHLQRSIKDWADGRTE
jgi:hypothetical protein